MTGEVAPAVPELAEEALRLVTALAHDLLPGSVGAGVTLPADPGQPVTRAATRAVVEDADRAGSETGGPGLAAWTRRELVRVDDVRTEQRWPEWARAAARLGVRGCVSVPLLAGERSLGALTVYTAGPVDLSPRDEGRLRLLAAQAALAAAAAEAHQLADDVSDHLRDAVRGRDVVNMAKGVLMARHDLDEETAVQLLLTTSAETAVPLQEVARQLLRVRGRR